MDTPTTASTGRSGRVAAGVATRRYGVGVSDALDPTLLVHAVELAPDGVLIVDHGGRIVYAEPIDLLAGRR